MTKKVHVYDMDGTIVCSLHRYRTILGNDGVERIDLPYWLENEHKAELDSLLPLAAQYQDDLRNPEIMVVIATARVLNAPDMRFIHKNLGVPAATISREGRSDTRSGADLKITGLSRLLGMFSDRPIVHFWEDNISYLKKVCDTIGAIGHYIPSKQGH